MSNIESYENDEVLDIDNARRVNHPYEV